MAKNRYLTMTESFQTNSQGNPFPDVVSNSIDLFETIDISEVHIIRKQDIMRIDLLMYEKYGYAYYDDIILNLNGIGSIHLMEPGDVLYLPSKRDLDNYFSKNLKRNSG